LTEVRLQGVANILDGAIRLSDTETSALTAVERRAVREAVLNLALRFLRLLNPTELYVNVFNGGSINEVLPAHFEEQLEAAREAAKLTALPDTASVVVISPSWETAQAWFDRIGPSLESAFRNPIVSDRARLTERLKTHFTTALDAKGLEFDVAVVPDISEFSDADPIALNGLYVAVSRPRHAILLGCRHSTVGHKVVKQLCHRGDLVQISLFPPQ